MEADEYFTLPHVAWLVKTAIDELEERDDGMMIGCVSAFRMRLKRAMCKRLSYTYEDPTSATALAAAVHPLYAMRMLRLYKGDTNALFTSVVNTLSEWEDDYNAAEVEEDEEGKGEDAWDRQVRELEDIGVTVNEEENRSDVSERIGRSYRRWLVKWAGEDVCKGKTETIAQIIDFKVRE